MQAIALTDIAATITAPTITAPTTTAVNLTAVNITAAAITDPTITAPTITAPTGTDPTGAAHATRRARPHSPRPAPPLTTARLCAATGASRGMLRLYEAEGLLAAPRRSASGYRHFPADTIDRVRAIRLLKELGFTLRQVSLLLADADDGPFDAAKIQALALAQLVQIDARIARLTLVRQYLAAVAHGDAESLMTDPDCRFLADFLAAAPEPEGPTA